MLQMLQNFDLKRLSSVSLDISAVRARCQTWRSPRNHRSGGLIAFEGVYQHGSAGSDDARFIRWTLRQYLELVRVDGLVIDCTGLTYEWGDELAFDVPPALPCLFALNPDHAEAYGYAVDKRLIRRSASAALAEIDDRIRTMKSRL